MSQDPTLYSPPQPKEAKRPAFKPGSRAAPIPTGAATGFQSAGSFVKAGILGLEGFAYEDKDEHADARPRKRRKTEDIIEDGEQDVQESKRAKKANAKPAQKRRKLTDGDSVMKEQDMAPKKPRRKKDKVDERVGQDKKSERKKQRRKVKTAPENKEDVREDASCPKTSATGSEHPENRKKQDKLESAIAKTAASENDSAPGALGQLKKVTLKAFRMPGASAAVPLDRTAPLEGDVGTPTPASEAEPVVKPFIETAHLGYEDLPADTSAPPQPMAPGTARPSSPHHARPLNLANLHESFAYQSGCQKPVSEQAQEVPAVAQRQPDIPKDNHKDSAHHPVAQKRVVSPVKKYTTITARAIDKDLAARRGLQGELEEQQTSANHLASFGFSASAKSKGQKIALNDVEQDKKPKRKRKLSAKPEKPAEKPLPEPAAAVARANRVDVMFGTSSQLREEDTEYRQDLQRAIEASEAEVAALAIYQPQPELAIKHGSKALQRGSRNLWTVSARGDEDSLLLPEDPEERRMLREVPNPPHSGPPPVEIPSEPSSFLDIDTFEPGPTVAVGELMTEPPAASVPKAAPSLPAAVISPPKSSGLRLPSVTSRPTLKRSLLSSTHILQPVSPNKSMMSRLFTTSSPEKAPKARGAQPFGGDGALTAKPSEPAGKPSKKPRKGIEATDADTGADKQKPSKEPKPHKERKTSKKPSGESTSKPDTSAGTTETGANASSEPKKRGRGRPKKDPNAPVTPKKKSTTSKARKKKDKETDSLEDLEAQAYTILEEIYDSDVPSPSPPRRKQADTEANDKQPKAKGKRKVKADTKPPVPAQLELSLSQAQAGADFDAESFNRSAKERQRQEKRAREAAAKAAALEAERKEAEVIFPVITCTIKEAPRTKDPANPSWWEKMLLYDPIVLEDLTGWLNEQGLRYSDESLLKPGFVQKWCESKSVCCLWKEGLRGGVKRKY